MGRPFIEYCSPKPSPSHSSNSSYTDLPDLESITSSEDISTDPYFFPLLTNNRIMNHEFLMAAAPENPSPSNVPSSEDPDPRDQDDFTPEAPAPPPPHNHIPRYNLRASTIAQANPRPISPRGVAPHRFPLAAAQHAILPHAAPPQLPPELVPPDMPVNSAPSPVQRTIASTTNPRVEDSFTLGSSPEPTLSGRAYDAYEDARYPSLAVPYQPLRPYQPYLHPRAHPLFDTPVGRPIGQIKPHLFDAPPSISASHEEIILHGYITPNRISGDIIHHLNTLRAQLKKLQDELGQLPHHSVKSIDADVDHMKATLQLLRRNTFSTLEDYHLVRTYRNDPSLSAYSPTVRNPALIA